MFGFGHIDVQYAVCAAVTDGQPVLRFSGETENSPKMYKCLKSYLPEPGDRVILINGVVIGGWK